jgi:hypothetical protein
MTLQAGIHLGVPTADYFADPAPQPSLTQSLAKIILERSPLHAWYAHPRLNPDFRPDHDTKYDVGNIAHMLMIGRGKELVVLDAFEDWRTKDAKARREEAAKEGKLAVLGKHFALADKMIREARAQLDLRGERDLFRNGDGEVVTIWQEGPIWLRQMIDWLTPDRLTVADYKTTDMSVAPHNLGRMMSNAGWHIQAAMAKRGLDVIQGEHLRRYVFVVQETEVPYALSVVELSDDVMTMGHKMLDAAVSVWRKCITRDRWPGYPLDVCTPEFPGWAEQQWLDREIHEAAQNRIPQNILDAG